jgi:hypothetical protein
VTDGGRKFTESRRRYITASLARIIRASLRLPVARSHRNTVYYGVTESLPGHVRCPGGCPPAGAGEAAADSMITESVLAALTTESPARQAAAAQTLRRPHTGIGAPLAQDRPGTSVRPSLGAQYRLVTVTREHAVMYSVGPQFF